VHCGFLLLPTLPCLPPVVTTPFGYNRKSTTVKKKVEMYCGAAENPGGGETFVCSGSSQMHWALHWTFNGHARAYRACARASAV
jgi:hypothetical protein